MLERLHDRQPGSDESVSSKEMSISVETYASEGAEVVRRTYTFCYAPEWDKWTFVEYVEKRSDDTRFVTDRDWRESRSITSEDGVAIETIDVPPEVSEALREATTAESITIQIPRGSALDPEYEEVSA